MSLFEASVTAGESGPVVVLSGETDITSAGQLSELLTAQLAGGAVHLLIDVSELRFADSASVRVMVLAARTLKERGGTLALARPQRAVARVLELLGADQVIRVLSAAELEQAGKAVQQEPER